MKHLSLIEIAFFLKKISIFEDLDLDLLLAIADKMNQDIYDKNEKVFEINQKPIKMYFIAIGEVRLLDKNKKIIKDISQKTFFGEESIFNERLREYSSICITDTLLLNLTKTNLITIMTEAPIVAISLLEIFSKNVSCKYLKN